MCHQHGSNDCQHGTNNSCSNYIGGDEVIYNNESKGSDEYEAGEGKEEAEDPAAEEGCKEPEEDGNNSDNVICISDCEGHVA